MRSSKSRSRSKSNRNRSVGNIMNRVFDSSGPEGKVRGTPQQIIEKYNQLARDAQLGNDPVAAENFMQHAEHYTRLLSAAQREMEARREQQEREQRERQQAREEQRRQQQQPQSAAAPAMPAATEVIDPTPEGGSGLVETPEESRARRRPSRGRRSRGDDTTAASISDTGGRPDAPETPEAAE